MNFFKNMSNIYLTVLMPKDKDLENLEGPTLSMVDASNIRRSIV